LLAPYSEIGRAGHRQMVRVAVHGGRRRADDAPGPGGYARPQHVQAAQHVHPGVEVRLPNRAAHVRLRRRMEHDLRPEARDDVLKRARIADVDPLEPGLGRDVGGRSRGEIVHHAHLVTIRQQAIDEMGADEPRSTCHQRA